MDTQTTTTETKKPPVPRGPNPENQKRLDHILARTNKEPGVASPVLAKELGISTLQCSQLTDRLVKKGDIQIRKVDGGVRTNYPKGYDMSSLPPIEAKKPVAPATPPAPASEEASSSEEASASEEASTAGDADGSDLT